MKTNIIHKTVMVPQVLEYLAPQPGKLYIDATFGTGGHTQAILDHEPTCNVIAFDWDLEVLKQENAQALLDHYGDRLKIVWGNFALIQRLLKKEKIEKIDGVLADFGTSQFQIFGKEGFSFRTDTPLDMRMSTAHQKQTAADIVNTYSEKELATLLYEYGEEPYALKIARAIVLARKRQKIVTTQQLVTIIENTVKVPSFKRKSIHSATKTFQALRIKVNHELENIQGFLTSSLPLLADQARIVCISFHSLEDRIVKTFFREHKTELHILTPKPIVASPEEIQSNPSARSAKLRAAYYNGQRDNKRVDK